MEGGAHAQRLAAEQRMMEKAQSDLGSAHNGLLLGLHELKMEEQQLRGVRQRQLEYFDTMVDYSEKNALQPAGVAKSIFDKKGRLRAQDNSP